MVGDEKKTEDRNGKKNGRRRKKAPAEPCPSRLRDGVEPLADTVYLKPAEINRLRQEYGDGAAQRLVEILDAYKTNHPDKCAEYRDDYKVIIDWVLRRYREEIAQFEHSSRVSPPRRQPETFIDRLADMALAEEL